jgi:hypothetical protein
VYKNSPAWELPLIIGSRLLGRGMRYSESVTRMNTVCVLGPQRDIGGEVSVSRIRADLVRRGEETVRWG